MAIVKYRETHCLLPEKRAKSIGVERRISRWKWDGLGTRYRSSYDLSLCHLKQLVHVGPKEGQRAKDYRVESEIASAGQIEVSFK